MNQASKYQAFIFKNYSFDVTSKTLTLNYSFDDQIDFTESYAFDFDFVDYDPNILDRAVQALFFMAGVSYYKAYLPQTIKIQKGQLDKPGATFFSDTYQKGLGEYFYTNNLSPLTTVNFPTNSEALDHIDSPKNSGILVGVGGGKDSLLSIEMLRDQPKIATWSVGHREQLQPLIAEIGLQHFWVKRAIDPRLLELNKSDALNGHIPISAILGTAGTVVAVLTGYGDVVVSNENSANEPTLNYQGVDINHQYSKSLDYEVSYQKYLLASVSNAVRYYSFLRPLSEVKIAELFAGKIFDKYQATFSSCNRAFTQASDHMSWCGECSKCAFTFLAFTPFVPRGQLEKVFHGKNLLQDPALESTYRNLLGISGEKPLDCVGEIKESREAMMLAKKVYPELDQKYQFDIPSDYSYKTLSAHSMPEEIYSILAANS